MSRVNQGSINAKSAAGLTYQTQLPMLNTQPRQQPGQEQRNSNEALCGGWARPAEGWCARGLNRCENRWGRAQARGASSVLRVSWIIQVLLPNSVCREPLPTDPGQDWPGSRGCFEACTPGRERGQSRAYPG